MHLLRSTSLLCCFLGWLPLAGLAQPQPVLPKGLKVAPDFPAALVRENLGPGVNSPVHDLAPLLSPDGQTLYFSRTSGVAGYDQDIWVATRQADGSWGSARNIGAPLNNFGPNMVCSVTPDGNTLLLLNTYYPNGSYKGEGLSLSRRTPDGWSVPEEVVIPGYQNRARTHQYFLSADGRTLLLDMEQDLTIGGNDLYVSRKGSDGRWSAPLNLGRTINTPAAEQCPFLSADGKTLYFSSSGHPGYGSADIFVSKRLDDTWTRWSVPLNLGPAVNSAKWEAYFMLPPGKEMAYVVSDEWGSGKADIFRLRPPREKLQGPLVQLQGQVLDASTRQPVAADIVYENLADGLETARISSNPADGSYRVALPAGRTYGFRAHSDRYLAVTENLDLTAADTATPVVRDLLLAPLVAGQKVNLNSIIFYQSKADLLPSSFPELNRLVELLQTHPTMELLLEGHTDNQGEEDTKGAQRNLRLSEERVREVKRYLVKKGIEAERIQTRGHGGSKPLAPNDTEETRRLNRRVECTVVRE